MGCFGYICRHCGKNIREGEIAHLTHVRHDKVLGEVVGHYDSYGGVVEDNYFHKDNNDTVNSADEICKSCFDCKDTYKGKTVEIEGRRYTLGLLYGEIISVSHWINDEYAEGLAKALGTASVIIDAAMKIADIRDRHDCDYYKASELANSIMDELPAIEQSTYSGIIAYHEKCYQIAKRRGTLSNVPSDDDPNQSWGKPRKAFI